MRATSRVPRRCGTSWRRTRRSIRCCAISPACCGRSIRSTAAIRRLLEARLKALAAPNNPWHALADEQLALLDLRQGKADQARTTLRRLAQDTTAPSGVRGRAGALLGRLGG